MVHAARHRVQKAVANPVAPVRGAKAVRNTASLANKEQNSGKTIVYSALSRAPSTKYT